MTTMKASIKYLTIIQPRLPHFATITIYTQYQIEVPAFQLDLDLSYELKY